MRLRGCCCSTCDEEPRELKAKGRDLVGRLMNVKSAGKASGDWLPVVLVKASSFDEVVLSDSDSSMALYTDGRIMALRDPSSPAYLGTAPVSERLVCTSQSARSGRW